MNVRPSNIPSLTPLRGIAALTVAAFHFDEVVANFVNPQHTLLLKKSYLMVDLFFIMSGFIMLHVYGFTFAKSISKKDFVKFIGARFARVYPLHFFTLLFSLVMFYGLREPASPLNNPAAIPTHLLMLHSFGIHDIFTWNVPSWSISAEWWAYMLFPLLALVVSKGNVRAILLLSAVSVMLYFSIPYLLPRVNPFAPNVPAPQNLDVTFDFGYIRGIAGFMAGMITYYFYHQEAVVKYFNSDLASVLSILTTILLFHFGANDLLIAFSFVFLVLTISANQKNIYQLFQGRLFQYLGDISYSIYLTHGLALFTIAVPLVTKMGFVFQGPGTLHIPFFTGLWACSLFLLVVILISTGTYYLIEKPCRRWLNKKLDN